MKKYRNVILFFFCVAVYGQEGKIIDYSILKPKNQRLINLIEQSYGDSSLYPGEKSNIKIVTISLYRVVDTVKVGIGLCQQLFTDLETCDFYHANYCGAFYHKDKLILVRVGNDKEIFNEFFEKSSGVLKYNFLFGYNDFEFVYYTYINNKFVFDSRTEKIRY